MTLAVGTIYPGRDDSLNPLDKGRYPSTRRDTCHCPHNAGNPRLFDSAFPVHNEAGMQAFLKSYSLHPYLLSSLIESLNIMLRSTIRVSRSLHLSSSSSSVQSRLASSLVFLEHKGGKLNDSSLNAVTAAKSLDGEVS